MNLSQSTVNIPRFHRVVQWGLLFIGVCLFAELGAFLGFRIVDHHWFSYQRLDDQRQAAQNEIQLRESQLDGGDTQELMPQEVAQALHPYLGFVMDRDAPPVFQDHLIPVSDYGFADKRSPIHRRTPETYLVGIVGGSVAEMFFRMGTATLEEQLRKNPELEGREIVFVNLAVRGHKQPQQLLTFVYLLALGGELDALINIDGFNEVAFLRRNRNKGVATIFPNNWHLRASAFPDLGERRILGDLDFGRYVRIRWAAAMDHFSWSIGANLIWRLGDNILQARIAEKTRDLINHKPQQKTFTVSGPRRSHDTESEELADRVGTWQRCSLQLDSLAQANQVRYFHFLQPNQYVPDSKIFLAKERTRAISESGDFSEVVPSGYSLLKKYGADLIEKGVSFHDLTMLFHGIQQPIYSDTCCHLNSIGNEIVAEAIGEVIASDLARDSR